MQNTIEHYCGVMKCFSADKARRESWEEVYNEVSPRVFPAFVEAVFHRRNGISLFANLTESVITGTWSARQRHHWQDERGAVSRGRSAAESSPVSVLICFQLLLRPQRNRSSVKTLYRRLAFYDRSCARERVWGGESSMSARVWSLFVLFQGGTLFAALNWWIRSFTSWFCWS